MTAPQPQPPELPPDPHEVDPAAAREVARERLVMDYPVEFDRLPDALRGDSADS